MRELENLIRRVAALYAEDRIGADVIAAELADAEPTAGNGVAPRGESLSEAVGRHMQAYFDAHGDALPASGIYERVLREIERPLITLCLSATRGNQIRAAALLGLNRNTLRKKIRELDIPIQRGVK